jgi:hypothetical protein
MMTLQNTITARLYAGLYLRTQRQMRFWGWSNRGWGSMHSAEAERPVPDLASWLRLAHTTLDRDRSPLPDLPSAPSAFFPAHHAEEQEAKQQARPNRRFQFVCNRRMIGWIIR